jgi:hypothetical protein
MRVHSLVFFHQNLGWFPDSLHYSFQNLLIHIQIFYSEPEYESVLIYLYNLYQKVQRELLVLRVFVVLVPVQNHLDYHQDHNTLVPSLVFVLFPLVVLLGFEH